MPASNSNRCNRIIPIVEWQGKRLTEIRLRLKGIRSGVQVFSQAGASDDVKTSVRTTADPSADDGGNHVLQINRPVEENFQILLPAA